MSTFRQFFGLVWEFFSLRCRFWSKILFDIEQMFW
jgi:hypothetical protein